MSLKNIIKLKQNIPIMSPNDSVMNAIQRMRETGSGCVLVSDKSNKLIGLYSERDVMIQLAERNLVPRLTKLEDVMLTEIIKIEDTTSPAEALQVMVDGRIRHLPVVTKDNEIVGMISLRYLLHDRIKELGEEIKGLQAYLNDAQGG
jgi:trk system potassium uptake protein TrkH